MPPVAPTRSSRDDRGQRAVEQCAGVGVAQSREHQLGQPVRIELSCVALARCDEHGDRIGLQAPRHEYERIGRRAVEPVGVVDHAQQRLRVRGRRQQAQDGHGDEEAVLDALGRQPEGAPQRRGLHVGQLVGAVEHGPQQLVQAGEGQLGLGLDAGAGEHPHAVRALPAHAPAARSCRSRRRPAARARRCASQRAASSRPSIASHSLSRPRSTVRLYAGLGGGTSDPLDATRVPVSAPSRHVCCPHPPTTLEDPPRPRPEPGDHRARQHDPQRRTAVPAGALRRLQLDAAVDGRLLPRLLRRPAAHDGHARRPLRPQARAADRHRVVRAREPRRPLRRDAPRSSSPSAPSWASAER